MKQASKAVGGGVAAVALLAAVPVGGLAQDKAAPEAAAYGAEPQRANAPAMYTDQGGDLGERADGDHHARDDSGCE